MKNLAIFGSGAGSNAENICNYFNCSKKIKIALMCTNNKDAKIALRAKKLNIPLFLISKNDLKEGFFLTSLLKDYNVDYIILAGFLLKIPQFLIDLYPKKIINIHPSLLPKYGGKGMYGKNIHQKVLENNELETGITIHYVNKNYDEGEIIFQKKLFLSKNESVDSLEEKIHLLEFSFFPKIIEKIINK